jgi:hypothetical protein
VEQRIDVNHVCETQQYSHAQPSRPLFGYDSDATPTLRMALSRFFGPPDFLYFFVEMFNDGTLPFSELCFSNLSEKILIDQASPPHTGGIFHRFKTELQCFETDPSRDAG